MENNEPLDPIEVRPLRSERIVLQPDDVSDAVKEFHLARFWGGDTIWGVQSFTAFLPVKARNRRSNDVFFHVIKPPNSTLGA